MDVLRHRVASTDEAGAGEETSETASQKILVNCLERENECSMQIR